MELYTLGHSAHPLSHFLSLLTKVEIHTLVDVRSTPASRFHPQYNKKPLQAAVEAAGITYLYLGSELGGRPTDPGCYPAERPAAKGRSPHPVPDFEIVMQREWFFHGMLELVGIAQVTRTAILCSEEDPGHCHRKLLISEYLQRAMATGEFWVPDKLSLYHLRGDGRVEAVHSTKARPEQ